MRANLVGKNKSAGLANNADTAKATPSDLISPESESILIHAGQHDDYVEVDCLTGHKQMHVKIALDKLQEFAIEKWHDHSRPGDVTIYDFIDENLVKIIEAYLAAGKETMPL